MNNRLNWLQILLGCFFCFAVIAPLLSMFLTIDAVHLNSVFSNRAFKSAAYNSVLYSCCSALLSIFLGGLAAWCVNRSKIKLKKLFIAILTLPMLIPSISHGTGLVILLGANGILTNLLELQFNIYGGLGIILGSVMYSLPVSFLMFYDILKYEDALPYDVAETLGINKFHQFKDLTLPYLRKPLISIAFAVFTMIITDYGVPLMVGGHVKTLPVMMYEDVIGLLEFKPVGGCCQFYKNSVLFQKKQKERLFQLLIPECYFSICITSSSHFCILIFCYKISYGPVI